MAVKTVFIDDLDGTPIAGSANTTTFSLNDAMYEIDLTPENTARLKDALAPFVKAGRRVVAPPEVMARVVKNASNAAKRRGAGRHSNGANNVTAIREWARANGFTIGDRGRIPTPVLEAYNAANAG